MSGTFMGSAESMGFLLVFFSFLLLNVSENLVRAQRTTPAETKFAFRGFKGNETVIQREGASRIESDGLLRLTDQSKNVTGTAFYRQPVRLLSNATVSSFSTSFVFAIIHSGSDNGGFGFTFTLSPTSNRPGAESGQYLGLLSRSNNGDRSNHVFAVEFDTVQGFKDGNDSNGNHVGLNFNNLSSEVQAAVIYYDGPDRQEDFQLQSGDPIRADIHYDGPTTTLNVTVYPWKPDFKKPSQPLISRQVPKLLEIVQEEMFVGFTASTGEQSSAHYVMGWSFSSGGEPAEELDLSDLPPPPKKNANKRGYNRQVIALIAALSGVTLIFLVLLFIFVMYKKRIQQEEILEDWEIDHPHRFRYKDLFAATKGFREGEIIGVGGFGTVYRGTLPSSTTDSVAVKKITPNSMQGVREFVAEIESLGKLRHKNLVNLQGWCKHKTDLLLIYDYIPNGSLDSLLYKKPRENGVVLKWDARFRIAKGIASGLLYLHEEWEQVVVHRDVKSSNVLIDSEMNPRLGDFGLARLYERGTLSHTTNVVGTIGYIAPELARNGRASTASDVFAFGVLLLEIVCGRKPTDSENFFVAEWAMELYESGKILRAVDRRLGSEFSVEEARLSLVVGLQCCHQKPAFRPPMRKVLRYLNGDEDVPNVDGNWFFSDSSRDEFGPKLMGYVSSDMVASSYTSSSITRVSSDSIVTGR
ncbi:PREDICTED: lectin-domain containing receptor kinase VI.3-like [Tarenaya hassleriana]|uniref:lectin-domain containing receptor kinase VI.3-like n=1 Tax=Tarenaya hassleriana TaxID=28532 RepID=UPI00053C715D|nr:PREDICTED: lectin-domain containing receptor kinase VI.3-like [Tarenaya hassleriana]